MARPKQIVTRDETVQVRFSPLEKKALELMAEQTGLSVSEYLRRAAFNQEVKRRFSPEELTLYRDLHHFRNSFAAIGNLVRGKAGPAALVDAITALKEQMEAHLKRFDQ